MHLVTNDLNLTEFCERTATVHELRREGLTVKTKSESFFGGVWVKNVFAQTDKPYNQRGSANYYKTHISKDSALVERLVAHGFVNNNEGKLYITQYNPYPTTYLWGHFHKDEYRIDGDKIVYRLVKKKTKKSKKKKILEKKTMKKPIKRAFKKETSSKVVTTNVASRHQARSLHDFFPPKLAL